ncbi:SIR2 family protein [Bathymodiolus azoricus thioautotrophic gill symbiont]|uniref:SIR2 family protein n=1 Tax=Bathymodiolus azoricus thioautotrophic gill symbiont TaxID=235205 RepID=UPI000B88D60D|nr:SIR2 family protein [Bathymodiolus azoricus thioautotrophic gill symbiont]
MKKKRIKKEYFKKSIRKNICLLTIPFMSLPQQFLQYKKFYKTINALILQRESSLLSKQVNIFTTNVDIFSEIALEDTGIEFNDGFHGRFNPKYSIGNFKKSYYKTSLHYENTSEIPVFNVIKLHGSVSWCTEDKNIKLDKDLKLVKEISNSSDDKFKENYDKLMIVNPSKKKFRDTVLNETHYDLLRMYNNELEKENSVLFVMGFSFADEHIKELTLRAANTNPTCVIYIFVHDDSNDIYKELKDDAKNNNIRLLTEEKYNFEKINNFFFKQLNKDNQKLEDSTEINQQ